MSQPYELTDDQYRWADSPGDPEGPVTDEPMVERMEALEAVATCRPWEVYETQGDEYGIRGGPLCSEGCCQDIIVYDGPSEADANFIVATRNALPTLLSQLREQRGALERIARDGCLKRTDGGCCPACVAGAVLSGDDPPPDNRLARPTPSQPKGPKDAR